MFCLCVCSFSPPPSLSRCQYPYAGKIEHNWVAFEWAHDCGLAHLTEPLTSHLVDGRVLNSLTKDDLKRYLKITKKVDQLSFLSGVELLRMHDFNREVCVGGEGVGQGVGLYMGENSTCEVMNVFFPFSIGYSRAS